MKDTPMPMINGVAPILVILLISNSNKDAPIIAGTESRNEKRPAASLFRPQKRPQTMVDPDLLIPGIMAAPCIRPTSRAEIRPGSLFFFILTGIKRLDPKINPVTINITPTKNADSNIWINKGLKITPIKPVGTVPISIQRMRAALGIRLISLTVFFLDITSLIKANPSVIIAFISPRKKIRMASNVPI